jgi:hypothetical protein
LHADTDDAEADAIAGGTAASSAGDGFRVDETAAGDGQGFGGAAVFAGIDGAWFSLVLQEERKQKSVSSYELACGS